MAGAFIASWLEVCGGSLSAALPPRRGRVFGNATRGIAAFALASLAACAAAGAQPGTFDVADVAHGALAQPLSICPGWPAVGSKPFGELVYSRGMLLLVAC